MKHKTFSHLEKPWWVSRSDERNPEFALSHGRSLADVASAGDGGSGDYSANRPFLAFLPAPVRHAAATAGLAALLLTSNALGVACTTPTPAPTPTAA
ncbi:hypothetical protein HYU17_04040, partial [Candidatus Woesearchaeota archaeon]|nr:hypothetical protein [Candidatus Woesearchaeota archaeon]